MNPIYVLLFECTAIEDGLAISCHESEEQAQTASVDRAKMYMRQELEEWEGAYFDDLDYDRLCELQEIDEFVARYRIAFTVCIYEATSFGQIGHLV